MRIRTDLPPTPARMKHLPLDHRGYPVPWFVGWTDGKPDFRVIRPDGIAEALKFERCWLCGGRRGKFGAFVIGPMCAINRVSAAPPSHRECAEYAVRACPFLVRPSAKRREAALPDHFEPAGHAIPRNPGVSLLWISRSWKPFRAPGGLLIDVGRPHEVSFWREGRTATRPEILHSIDTGFPLLEAAARKDGPQAVWELHNCRDRAMTLLPAA